VKTKIKFSSMNEHKIVLCDRSSFKVGSISRQAKSNDGKPYFEAIGLVKDQNCVGVQAIFYPDSDWTPSEAANHASLKYEGFQSMQPSINTQDDDDDDDDDEEAKKKKSKDDDDDKKSKDDDDDDKKYKDDDDDDDDDKKSKDDDDDDDKKSKDDDDDDDKKAPHNDDKEAKGGFDLMSAISTGAKRRKQK